MRICLEFTPKTIFALKVVEFSLVAYCDTTTLATDRYMSHFICGTDSRRTLYLVVARHFNSLPISIPGENIRKCTLTQPVMIFAQFCDSVMKY